MMTEAKRLHALGLGLHWLKPKSKAPIESGWTKGERKSLKELMNSKPLKCNLGVRLGRVSKLSDGCYLGVIDCDVKSTDPKHKKEMLAALDEMWVEGPTVLSGRRNGSRHIYVKSSEPLVPRRVKQSSEKVRVMMPSSRPSIFEKNNLSLSDLEAGFRLRPAWEIAIMGEGQQVVLPPSIHPDTGRAYIWKNGHALMSKDDLRLYKDPGAVKLDSGTPRDEGPLNIEEVDLLRSRLSKAAQALITDGLESSGDLSADLFRVAREMFSCGFTANQIATVCTNPENFISSAARKRRPNRRSQMQWVIQHTIKKIERQSESKLEFERVAKIDDSEVERSEELPKDDWKNKIKRTKDGAPKSLLENIIYILRNAVSDDIFKRDSFAMRDFYGVDTPWGGKKNAALTDDDAAQIVHWLGKKYNFEPGIDKVFNAMTVVAKDNAFDPVRERLERLPEWDGVERLNVWLSENFEAEGEPEYLGQVFRKWFVAMVTRVYEPGFKFDWMPIFEGAQGVGKSSFGRILVGNDWFLDWLPNLQDKDAALALQGIWCVEIGELASLRKNEMESVKAFLTRTVDKVRPPYGKRWLESYRRCVFFGTTNRDQYLRDETGNRRFKPVKVGQLNFEALRKDREQLFAEAVFIYKLGLENELSLNILDGEAKGYEAEIQAEKMIEDDASLMKDLLRDFIKSEQKKPENERTDFTKIRVVDLFNGGEGVGPPPLERWKFEARNVQSAVKALKSLGAEKRYIKGRVFWKMASGVGVGVGVK